MKFGRQAILGVMAGLVSSAILLGAISLAFVESGSYLALRPTQTATQTPLPAPALPTSLPGEPTYTPLPSPSPSATPTVPTPSACPPPAGWVAVSVSPDDTLNALAARYGIPVDQLAQANCLPVLTLMPGTILYVPAPTPTPSPTPLPSPTDTPAPTSVPTRTAVVCAGPPAGWIAYTVRAGDNLYQLSIAFGVSVYQIQQANCMGGSTFIRGGQNLFLPNVPTRTPYYTATQTFTPAPTFTAPVIPTSTPHPPTAVPTATPQPTVPPADTATSTPTPLPPTATPTETPAPTNTPQPTATATPSPVPTDTPTTAPTSTSSPVPTATTAARAIGRLFV